MKKAQNYPPPPPDKNFPLVSVIIPVYNTAPYLQECLDSVFSQSYTHLEIIAINDASPDKSAQILARNAIVEKRLRIIRHEKNQGLSSARNTGMDAAKGKYIYFVDSDDYLAPSAIDKLLKVAEKYNTDVCLSSYYDVLEKPDGTRILTANEWAFTWKNVAPLQVFHYTDSRGEFLRHQLNAAWNRLYLRDFLQANHLRFVAQVYEDVPFMFATYVYAKKMIYTTQHGYYYRRRAQSLSAQKVRMDILIVLDMAYDILQKTGAYDGLKESFLYYYFVHSVHSFNDVDVKNIGSFYKHTRMRLRELTAEDKHIQYIYTAHFREQIKQIIQYDATSYFYLQNVNISYYDKWNRPLRQIVRMKLDERFVRLHGKSKIYVLCFMATFALRYFFSA